MFFGAGLMEELMKAVPALIGLAIALRVPGNAANPQTSRYLDWLRVSSPLEGLMIGLAAGAGFIFVETLFQYVPNTVNTVTKTSGAGSGFANGFALLLPRVLQGVIGHMAWAGISGYFMRPGGALSGVHDQIARVWLVGAGATACAVEFVELFG